MFRSDLIFLRPGLPVLGPGEDRIDAAVSRALPARRQRLAARGAPNAVAGQVESCVWAAVGLLATFALLSLAIAASTRA
jgi:hypothetical protein